MVKGHYGPAVTFCDSPFIQTFFRDRCNETRLFRINRQKRGGEAVDPMEEIYRTYADSVCRYLLAQTHDPDLAEDLTQETFVQAIRCIERYDGSCQLSTWLCAIAKNQWLVWLRKHPRTAPLEETEAVTGSPEGELLEQTERMELLKLLHACPEPYREIIYLRIYGDLSFAQIGEIMGKSENWARVTFYRGKERLRKELEQR